jgi:hypothetical protein
MLLWRQAEARCYTLTVLLVALAIILQTTPGLPKEQIQLLDSQGNPLPPHVEEHLYFSVNNRTYTAPDFKALFNNTSMVSSNLTVFYSFCGVNWSLKHEIMNNSSITLHLRRLGNIAFRIRAVDTQYRWSFETLALSDVVAGKAIPELYILAQSANRSLSFENCEPNAYFPLMNASSAPYLWRLIAVFSNNVILNESLNFLWEKGITDLALAKIPKDLNLSWIAGWCPGAYVQATITCDDKVLRNSPPSTLMSAQSAWFYPMDKNCSVRLTFAGREKVCSAGIMELKRCMPEIYLVKVNITGVSGYEPIEVKANAVDVRIDDVLLDLQRPEICLWNGTHSLELRYNFSGTWITLVNRSFIVAAPAKLPVQLNFSRIKVLVHGCKLAPQVLINGINVHVERQNATYTTASIPVINANVTIKVCDVTFSSNVKTENAIFTIIVPAITNLEFEQPNTFPLLMLFALATIQVALIVYAWIVTRRL